MELNLNDSEFVYNKLGVKIRKCCASCIFKHPDDEKYRICKLGGMEEKVHPYDLCRGWRMQPKFDNAGKGDGRIKKPEYFQYLADCIKQNGAYANLEQVSEDFEAENGSKYLII